MAATARMAPAVLALAILAHAAWADDPTRPPRDRLEVPGLVHQLGGDTFVERTEASRRLMAIGARALPALREALASPDLEIRRRARRLVNRIEARLFRELRQLGAHRGSVNAVAFSPDGKYALSGDSGAVRLFEVATGKEVARNEDHRDRVMAVAFSPDGKYAATGGEDRTVFLHDATRLTAVKRFREHRADVRAVLFSCDGKRLISADLDGGIVVRSVPEGKVVVRLKKVGADRVFSAATLGDDRLILAPGRANDALLWRMNENDATCVELTAHKGLVMGVAASRNGKRLVTAGHDSLVVIWDVKSGKPVHRLRGHTGAACCVAVSADGRLAVSGGIDGLLRLWDLAAARAIRPLRGHTNPIWSVAISPDGRFAASGSADGTMRLWSLAP